VMLANVSASLSPMNGESPDNLSNKYFVTNLGEH
jgi:hypothetical protein